MSIQKLMRYHREVRKIRGQRYSCDFKMLRECLLNRPFEELCGEKLLAFYINIITKCMNEKNGYELEAFRELQDFMRNEISLSRLCEQKKDKLLEIYQTMIARYIREGDDRALAGFIDNYISKFDKLKAFVVNTNYISSVFTCLNEGKIDKQKALGLLNVLISNKVAVKITHFKDVCESEFFENKEKFELISAFCNNPTHLYSNAHDSPIKEIYSYIVSFHDVDLIQRFIWRIIFSQVSGEIENKNESKGSWPRYDYPNEFKKWLSQVMKSDMENGNIERLKCLMLLPDLEPQGGWEYQPKSASDSIGAKRVARLFQSSKIILTYDPGLL